MMLKKIALMLLAVFAMLVIASCGSGGSGDSGDSAQNKGKIAIGSKNFTEQIILGELYAQKLEAEGYQVERKLDLGSVQVTDRALRSNQIQMYPEYTGTALETVLDAEKTNFDTPQATYEEAKKLYAERDPAMTMLEPADFNNTYGIAVVKDAAQKYDLKTLNDLAKASPNLVFASFSEFQKREDGFPNLKENYPQMDFKNVRIVNSIGLKYQALAEGDAQATPGFTTDGQLASDDLVVMEDTKKIWPFYYPAPVVRSDWLDEHQDARAVMNEVSASLDVQTMRELNAKVDLQQEDPEDVAREFLEQEGLI